MKSSIRHQPTKHRPHRKGRHAFTLIELLIVMGIVGVLASVTIIAVNPKKQLCAANDAKRKSYERQLENAIIQYIIGEWTAPGGDDIPSGAEAPKPICRKTIVSDDCVNLDVLAPVYIAELPVDVLAPSDSEDTGYLVYKDDHDRLVVTSSYDDECQQIEAIGGPSSSSSGGSSTSSASSGPSSGSSSSSSENSSGSSGSSQSSSEASSEDSSGFSSSVVACGDATVNGAEACDDGGFCYDGLYYGYYVPSEVTYAQCVGSPPGDVTAQSGDGCSNTCTVESGYECTGSPSVCTQNSSSSSSSSSEDEGSSESSS